MIIGIDFDNTIACHDKSFIKIALSEGISVLEGETPKQKLKKSYLNQEFGNLLWTQTQGKVYGTEISSAELFQGFLDFLEKARFQNHKILVISHRTIFPATGDTIDLHKAAMGWMEQKELLSPERISHENCFFETTLEKKLERIEFEGCDLFVDDLTTVLGHERFPDDTKRILFGKKHESLDFVVSWKNADRLLDCPKKKSMAMSSHTTLPTSLHEDSFRKLLNLPSYDKFRLETLRGGANNRSYKISTCNNIFMGKVYFQDSTDRRNRLLHESSFARYLETLERKNFPKLIAKDEALGIAIFDWLPGEVFESSSPIDYGHWDKCFDFITHLQRGRHTEAARGLPCASESAFSIRDHWAILQERHDFWRRRVLSKTERLPSPIHQFLMNDLEKKYKELAQDVLASPCFHQVLAEDERILSPSDFGLHNAMLHRNGSLCFYDFEYAGWDDPAKTIADFFAQPKHKPPSELFSVMKNRILELLPERKVENFITRLPLVFRMINLKWCYICLNVFHPADQKRRELAEASEIDLSSLTDSLNKLIQTSSIPRNA